MAEYRESEVALELEREIRASLDSLCLAEPLLSTVCYALFPGGKRIRPLLSLAILEDCGVKRDKFMPVAAVIELLHNASLIHDDLPALDNDELRRGRQTCHIACGEASAVLAGDVLVSSGIYLVTRSDFKPAVKLGMISSLSRAYTDLCSGQQLDLARADTLEIVEEIHRLKTGALFSCAAELAVLAAGHESGVVERAKEFGSRLGLYFQMSDDFIDLFGTARERGRPKSSDIRNKKTTSFLNQDLRTATTHLLSAGAATREALSALGKSIGKGDMPETRSILNRISDRIKLSGNDISVAQNQ